MVLMNSAGPALVRLGSNFNRGGAERNRNKWADPLPLTLTTGLDSRPNHACVYALSRVSADLNLE